MAELTKPRALQKLGIPILDAFCCALHLNFDTWQRVCHCTKQEWRGQKQIVDFIPFVDLLLLQWQPMFLHDSGKLEKQFGVPGKRGKVHEY